MIDSIQHFFEGASDLVRFAVVTALILLTPKIFERMRLPGVLALILVGVSFGPRGLHLFKQNGEVLMFFAVLGKLLLLFFSGLDIEVDELRKNAGKALRLSALCFGLPTVAGVLIGYFFDYSMLSSLMIGVLFSSHSIIAYPILTRLGLTKIEPVAVTVGATAMTDIASLILFAICLPIHTTGFLLGQFTLQVVYIVIFIPVIIYSFRWLGHQVFRHLGTDPAQQLIFLLSVVAIAAQGAEWVNIDPIVGAFLAGLAVSSTLPDKGIRTQLDTLGNTLFIPAFFISLGVLIDPAAILTTIRQHVGLVVAVIASLAATKMLAAWLAGKQYHYSPTTRILIGSLTIPQVSSTLAVALVAYESMNAAGERLLDEKFLNSILVLMVVSAVGGTVLTQWAAKALVAQEDKPNLGSERNGP